MLMDVVQEMDKLMFDYYIKQRASALNQIIRDGILNSGIDWYETPRPTGVLHAVFNPNNIPLTEATSRNPYVHVRRASIPRRSARASQQRR